ncbi:MAG: pyridoxal-phosphate-dependent aminotransferase family protein [Chloroflexota bacterium]
MTDVQFRVPGPTPLPPQVLAAMQRPMIPHRGPEFKALYKETLRLAREAHRTDSPVLLWPGSGSSGWESAIVNLLAPGDAVLSASCGEFGERFAKIGTRFGLDVRMVEVLWGQAITPQILRAGLDANPDVRAVFITHNETSTGIANPLKELAAVVRDHGALVVVDGVSGAGCLPMEVDAWGLDFVMSGSQKAWMTPPGLFIAAIGPRAWEASKRSGYPRFFWDIEAARNSAEEGVTPTTPPLTMVFAIHAALEMMIEEGMPNVWARHHRLGELTRRLVNEAGFDLFADPHYASDSVTAFLLPEGVSAKAYLKRMADAFNVIGQGGQGAFADSTIRLGHMGWVNEQDMIEAVAAVRAIRPEFIP